MIKRKNEWPLGNTSHGLNERCTSKLWRRGIVNDALYQGQKVKPFLVCQLKLGSRSAQKEEKVLAQAFNSTVALKYKRKRKMVKDKQAFHNKTKRLIANTSRVIRH